jgi:hypothetical protein
LPRSRNYELFGRKASANPPTPPLSAGPVLDPEEEAILADSIGMAMLVVLEMLTPAERVAFVLHDMFAVPFDEIAQILGRAPAAARQLASRVRRRVQGRGADRPADGMPTPNWSMPSSAPRVADFRGLLESSIRTCCSALIRPRSGRELKRG